MTYSEKLKDPKWQKKRLKILERDLWCCQTCHNKSDTLNIHHLEYQKGLDPWEYEAEELITLCEGHHEFITRHKIPRCLIQFWVENRPQFYSKGFRELSDKFEEFMEHVCLNVYSLKNNKNLIPYWFEAGSISKFRPKSFEDFHCVVHNIFIL